MQVVTLPFDLSTTGTVRVGGTRVTLETVVNTYLEGASAEEIVDRYSTLKLADVYKTIGFYLDHTSEVEEYLTRVRKDGERVQAENELRFSPYGVRNKLLARLESQS